MGAKSGRNRRGGGRGRPKKGGAPKAPARGRSRGAQRLGLIAFGVLAVGLFVVFWVADGLGAPSVPSGAIAQISHAPEKYATPSEAEYKKTVEQQEAQQALKKPPKAGSKKAEELHTAAVGELLNRAAIFGEGEELGIKITPKEVEAELEKVKKESFKTEKAFQEFLKESHYTEEDVNQRIELQILSTKIQEKITKEAPPATEAEAKEYYEAEKAAQYTKKPSRDVRVVVNENKKEVEAAQKALEADNSKASWEKVTKKYSPTTEANAGLQKEITEEFLQEPLKKDIFTAATGELIGPVKQAKNYLLLEVVKLNPQSVQPFAEVKTTISTQLTQEKQQKYFSEWVAGFQTKWRSRTQCASGFQIEQCANYPSSAAIAKAREEHKSCYEADPKKPPTECPAAVTMNAPAVPGTVTVAKPEGEPLVQRPRPEAAKKEKGKGEAAAGAEGAAGGAEGSSAETEAAVKAAEEAAAEAAAEGGE